MPAVSPKPEFDNAAWVYVPTRLDAKTLFEFCLNIETLFRLNPYLSISQWRTTEDGAIINWQNHSTETAHSLNSSLSTETNEYEICVHYQTGIKQETYFIVEANDNGANLIILDRYADNANELTDNVDKSIHAWGEALNRFFRHYKYIRRVPFIDAIIRRFWVKLSPMARRITYMLLVIAIVELVALMLLVFVLLLR